MSNNSVVLSSRIRLARNFADLPFPNRNQDKAGLCIDRIHKALNLSKDTYTFYSLYDLQDVTKGCLLEDRFITKDLLKNTESGAAFVRSDKKISVMANEDDHVRIQSIADGLNLKKALQEAIEVEKSIACVSQFSFSPALGYLTSCPTSTGTGLRASLMMHLPALVQNKKMGELIQNVAKLGLTIRGFYGEGSEALGDLYQLSNQTTLGRTEEEIIDSVSAVGKQIIEIELDSRVELSAKNHNDVLDRVSRSFGIMKHSYSMDTTEFYQLWSSLRMGAASSLIPVTLPQTDELLIACQDNHLKMNGQQDETPAQTRSRILRTALQQK